MSLIHVAYYDVIYCVTMKTTSEKNTQPGKYPPANISAAGPGQVPLACNPLATQSPKKEWSSLPPLIRRVCSQPAFLMHLRNHLGHPVERLRSVGNCPIEIIINNNWAGKLALVKLFLGKLRAENSSSYTGPPAPHTPHREQPKWCCRQTGFPNLNFMLSLLYMTW